MEGKNYFKSWVKEFKDEIIVFKDNDKIYVKSAICPHFGGPIVYDQNRKYLHCYWHGLQFSTDGKCLSQKNFKACLNSYVYKIVNNSIYIFKNENS